MKTGSKASKNKYYNSCSYRVKSLSQCIPCACLPLTNYYDRPFPLPGALNDSVAKDRRTKHVIEVVGHAGDERGDA